MADIAPIVSLNGEIAPTDSLAGELAMPEKVWMQGPPGPQGQQGEPGAAATVTVGTVTTGEPGTDAIVANSGTESAAVLNFTIPRGETGAVGAVGPQGPKGDKGDPGPAGAGVPDGGTVGQLLGKTETGTAWIDPPQSGGGGYVPKPLTYDYMPEGYPKKSVQTTTLMEEQQLAFTEAGPGVYLTKLTEELAIVGGQTYTVSWDGTEYRCICVDDGKYAMLGNLSIAGSGDDTGEPFVYYAKAFGTLDTSASHTISVTTAAEVITPMAEEFLPTGIKELIMNSSTANSAKRFRITVDDTGILNATEVT